jgi:hypothetical protein
MWAVRPGYSSGASSVCVDEEDESDEEAPTRYEPGLSRQSSILALSDLRREKSLRGDLATSLVRIEVRAYAIVVYIFGDRKNP